MNPHTQSTTWLLESQYAPYVDALKNFFTQGGYASSTAATCIAHFAHWLTQYSIDVHSIGEEMIRKFLDAPPPTPVTAKARSRHTMFEQQLDP